jgi:hypothetical protein
VLLAKSLTPAVESALAAVPTSGDGEAVVGFDELPTS